jgi:hypothetical protein
MWHDDFYGHKLRIGVDTGGKYSPGPGFKPIVARRGRNRQRADEIASWTPRQPRCGKPRSLSDRDRRSHSSAAFEVTITGSGESCRVDRFES